MGPGTLEKIRNHEGWQFNTTQVNVHKMENRVGYCSIISFVGFQDEQETCMGFGTQRKGGGLLNSNTTQRTDGPPTFLIRRNKCRKAGNLLQSMVFVQFSQLQSADEGL